MNPNILNRLQEIKDEKASKELALQRHDELVKETKQVQGAVVQAFSMLIDYLDKKTTKTEVVNQLTEIGTPDALKVVDSVNSLHDTLKTHENTDLTEVTAILKEVLIEAKQLPKEKVDITIPEQKDYVAQFKELTKAINSVEKVVKGQKLVAEAPIVNVPETQVNVEAPNLKPLETSISSGSKDVVKAVKGIKIPELDTSPVEKLLKKTNKLLEELPEYMPSGGGGGSSWIAVDSSGVPVPIQLESDGSIKVSGGGSTPNYTTRIEEDSVNPNLTYIGNAVIGTAESSSSWQIKRLDSTTGLIKLWANGSDDFNVEWDNRESETYA